MGMVWRAITVGRGSLVTIAMAMMIVVMIVMMIVVMIVVMVIAVTSSAIASCGSLSVKIGLGSITVATSRVVTAI